MRWILLLSLLLTGTSWAQSDSTSSVFPDNASLPYPTSLQDRASPQRLESSPQARQERYEASTAKKIALIPVNLLKVPLWIIDYPIEHWLVKRHPPPFIQRGIKRLNRLLATGYTIRYGGFGVGSGVGGGVAYRTLLPWTSKTYSKTFIGATLLGYQQYYVQLDRRFGKRSALLSRTQFFDQPRIEFYGTGLHSESANHSSYRLLTTSANLAGQSGFRRRSFFSWQLGYKHQNTRRGLTPDIPASVDLFAADEVEGLRGAYHLLEYGFGIGLDGCDHPSYAHRGTFLHASLQLTNGLGDQSSMAYTKYILELQQYVPLPGVRRTLAMRLHAVVTDNQSADSQSIPVWAFEQLGGSQSVRAIPNFRYADEDLVVANFEYRFPFWFLEHDSGVAIDALTFFDVGTVLPELHRMKQNDLRSSAGFGFRMVLRQNTLFKLDVGWTSQNFRIDVGVRGPL